MESLTFGTFIRANVIDVHSNGLHALVCIHFAAVHQLKSTYYGSSVRDSPFHSTLINRIVGTFWLTGPTINTFVRYFDSHKKIRFSRGKVTICRGIIRSMLSFNTRVEALEALRRFMIGDSPLWQEAKMRAKDANGWFTEEEIQFA